VFGAGYVGGFVARKAREHGATVTAVTRNQKAVAAMLADGIHAIEADLVDGAWEGAIAPRPDFVLYSASPGGAGMENYVRSYRLGLERVTQWLRDFGSASTFVYTSSTSVYPQDQHALVDEQAPTSAAGEDRPGILVHAEVTARAATMAYRRAFILRLAGIYGPQRHALLDAVKSGVVSGRPQDWLNLIHRDDIADAVLRCFAAPVAIASQTLNLSDGSPATRDEIVRWVAGRLGLALPKFTGVPRSSRRTAPLDRVIVSTQAREVLGWAPRFGSFREGYEPLLEEISMSVL